nr:DNA translocase FtsK 4TM domain-containing protein [Deltaproteobacteria bacterium]
MKKNPRHYPSPLIREIFSIVLFTITLGMTLSLISYDAADPSFSLYNTQFSGITNWLGVVGSYTADILLQVLGIVSFFLVLLLFHFSFQLFLTLRVPLTWLSGLGWIGLFISTCGILSLSLGTIRVDHMGNFTGDAGGFVGHMTVAVLTTFLSTVGTSIALGLLLILSLMGSLSFSLRCAGVSCVAALAPLKKIGTSLVTIIGNRFRTSADKKNTKKHRRADHAESEISRLSDIDLETETPTEISVPQYIQPELPLQIEVPPPRHHQPDRAFRLPGLDLLNDPPRESTRIDRDQLTQNSRLLEKKLYDFGIQASVVNVHPGPVITMYELEPAAGVKINRIVNLSDDLALALRAEGIRIVAPIPGRGAIGVEIPNQKREAVTFKEIIAQPEFLRSRSPLTLALGKDISGTPIITDLASLPHLLIAGTTGSGKSVFINTLICSLLYTAQPSQVKLLVVDPKRSEFTFYEDIPHLLYPVVTDAKQAADVLRWAVQEMDRRYDYLRKTGVRDILSYNKRKVPSLPAASDQSETMQANEEIPLTLPWIVIIIDELANLMMVASRDVEQSLARLAQMSRAAGIHLLVATQRPSVDVITGTIKANFPARISFRLTSKTDSRVIIDSNGAENLLNQGDMLFLSPRTARLTRIHGPFISDEEIRRIVDFLKSQARPEYQELELQSGEETSTDLFDDNQDEKYREAVELVTSLQQVSISLIQRKMRIGYNRAANIIERMEKDGIVGPSDGVKPREVLRKMVDI